MPKQQEEPEQDAADRDEDHPIEEAETHWQAAAQRLAIAREGAKKARQAEKTAQLEADAAWAELQMMQLLEKHSR